MHRNSEKDPTQSGRGPGMDSVDPPGFPIPGDLGAHLEDCGQEFLVDFLGEASRRQPGNQEVLSALSQSLARLGRRFEGLKVDEQLVALDPENPILHYNLACSRALNDDHAAAIESLTRAIELGFCEVDFIAQDPDLESLHGLRSFRRLLESLPQGNHHHGE
ncbi:MAG: hypothetical protein KDB61_06005 [Planctomycetes bacterium]|nr:hypothetical protein [Planctomycetota bacterium]